MEIKLIYKIVLEPFDENGSKGYHVSVPSLPGCVTWGKNQTEARERAREAITGHLEALVDCGMPIPADDREEHQRRKRADAKRHAAAKPATRITSKQREKRTVMIAV
jgi:predicted RNase H-like HicB family nuclease